MEISQNFVAFLEYTNFIQLNDHIDAWNHCYNIFQRIMGNLGSKLSHATTTIFLSFDYFDVKAFKILNFIFPSIEMASLESFLLHEMDKVLTNWAAEIYKKSALTILLLI